jgi:signal transduction histidine kinase
MDAASQQNLHLPPGSQQLRLAAAASLLEVSLDAVLLVHFDGRIVAANAAAHTLLGHEAGALDGCAVDSVAATADPRLDRALSLCQVDGKSRGMASLRGVDDLPFEAEVAAARCTLPEGGEAAWLILRPVAETSDEAEQRSRILGQHLRERTRELEIRNGELKAFSTAVSHDLRAPLAMIRSFSQVLAQSERLDAHARQHARRIQANAEHMNEIIEALLGLSGHEDAGIRSQEIDLAAMVEAVLLDCAEWSPADVDVDVRIAPGTQVIADPGLLRIVMINLLGNATKFTRRVAAPRVEVDCRPLSPWEVAIRVADNGAGFDPAQAHRLFQPFQRLHAAADFPGLGIGLATVLRIVERHGGRIEAHGEPGRGASFTVILPRQGPDLTLACRTCSQRNGTRPGCSTTSCGLPLGTWHPSAEQRPSAGSPRVELRP